MTSLLTPLPKPFEIQRKLSFDAYRAIPALNQSSAKCFELEWGGCPALFRHRLTVPQAESLAMRAGRQFHAFMLEPNVFEAHWSRMDQETCEKLFAAAKMGGKSKAKILSHSSAKEAFQADSKGFHALAPVKAWKAAQERAGKEIVSATRLREMRAMKASIEANPEIMGDLFDGRAFETELSLSANYLVNAHTGDQLPLKARLDYYRAEDGTLVDLKTCRTANPFEFARQAANLHYDFQAAWYCRVARLCNLTVNRFGFLAVDSEPPHYATIHWMPQDWLTYAWKGSPLRLGAMTLLSNIHGALKADRFPAYEAGELMPPEWLLNQMEEGCAA